MKCDGAYGYENLARYRLLQLLNKEQEKEIRTKWEKESPAQYKEFIELEQILRNEFQ